MSVIITISNNNDSIDFLKPLKEIRRQMQKSGLIKEMKKRKYRMKPSEKKAIRNAKIKSNHAKQSDKKIR